MQASIVIITTAAGKLQDDTASDSLDPAVTLWLVYAFLSVAVSGTLLALSYLIPTVLPAARLSQIAPRALPAEVERLCAIKGINVTKDTKEDEDADKSMTPRWINNEGMTLSENIGRWSVRGIGNGIDVEEPNRRAIA